MISCPIAAIAAILSGHQLLASFKLPCMLNDYRVLLDAHRVLRRAKSMIYRHDV